ncbi:hypothetical protein JCGZ_11886 [Jatropha curcas]|uniref:Uncharacterized protein n=1 Tax=Jatropha curcas TaxID=180498 RepID=A0A067LFF6_JATCU|nr:hypothetical protein JCGZ_11886 [Jatropha curcas]
MQVAGAWLLYKSNNFGEGFLSATLKGFTVIDDREGTKDEFRLAIGKPENIGYGIHHSPTDGNQHMTDTNFKDSKTDATPTMLILDAKFGQHSTLMSLCLQRPQLLVALDFLLAFVEFFVPTVGNMLSNEENKDPMLAVDSIILDESIFRQPSAEITLSPLKPLIVDNERFDHFIYDGRGGMLHLKDREGHNLCGPSKEAIIYVGSGKKLQFKNVVIKNGKYLDSCILLGSNSSYSATRDDQVYLEEECEASDLEHSRENIADLQNLNTSDRSTEFIIEFQAPFEISRARVWDTLSDTVELNLVKAYF